MDIVTCPACPICPGLDWAAILGVAIPGLSLILWRLEAIVRAAKGTTQATQVNTEAVREAGGLPPGPPAPPTVQ